MYSLLKQLSHHYFRFQDLSNDKYQVTTNKAWFIRKQCSTCIFKACLL